MPLGTDVTTTPPGDVVITVKDGGGGGGGGRPRSRGVRKIDIHVTWDPAYWRYLGATRSGHECDAGTGIAHWHKRPCPGGGQYGVTLRLSRRRAGRTPIIACAMDPLNGDYKGKRKWVT